MKCMPLDSAMQRSLPLSIKKAATVRAEMAASIDRCLKSNDTVGQRKPLFLLHEWEQENRYWTPALLPLEVSLFLFFPTALAIILLVGIGIAVEEAYTSVLHSLKATFPSITRKGKER